MDRRRRRRAAEDAAAARRRHPRIRLRAGAGPARQQGRHLYAGAVRRGEEERLDRDQHEERLESHLRIRINEICTWGVEWINDLSQPRHDPDGVARADAEMTAGLLGNSVASNRRQTNVLRMNSKQTSSWKDTRTQFEQIVLVLQGGGALGSYQAGVYQALAEADLHPNWVAGISIGAINSAIIAGNAPDKRVDRLREFWETVSTSPLGIPSLKFIEHQNAFVHHLVNQGRAVNILLFGAPNFFTPRMPPPALWPADTPDKASYYDTAPVKATLERLVDFDRINAGHMRFSVGATNVATGNFAYFDST